jgi:hypothetical protein
VERRAKLLGFYDHNENHHTHTKITKKISQQQQEDLIILLRLETKITTLTKRNILTAIPRVHRGKLGMDEKCPINNLSEEVGEALCSESLEK